jgi:fibronectin type 3 domain-containing protein
VKPLYNLSSNWETLSLSRLSRSILICLTALLIVSISFPKIIYAAQVTLEWEAVIHPLLEGYRVYYGTSSGDYDVSLDIGNWTSCTIADLEDDGTYYFAVTAYSTEGEESDFSNEVIWSTTNDDAGTGGGCFIDTASDG